MENLDKTTFSLEDNPDEEVVEEQVIERDEEYDDDDDYEDEDYGDEEDYDEDEDYGDEEEDYDDGYNDDYYDDRLDKVLDEIAELKRGMSSSTAPSTAVQQPFAPPQFVPQYIYQPPMSNGPAAAGSEVVMYNEISRLRDELAKNQSSLEMQKEISRIKDDMTRDQKFAESQYNAEIKRLQDRIDDLLKNAESPQGELPPPQNAAPARLEGGRSSLDFDKLLSINESILRTSKESDSRIKDEISKLKDKLEAMPSADDLKSAMESMKKASEAADGLNAEAVKKLGADIAALRSAIGGKQTPPVVLHDGQCDISSSELLRQLYDIKSVLGGSSEDAVKRTQSLLELVSEFKKVSLDVESPSLTFRDKLHIVYDYGKKLVDSGDQDAIDLINAVNALIKRLSAQKLDRTNLADTATFLAGKGTPVATQVRDGAEKFIGIRERIENAPFDQLAQYLPELLAERNRAESNRNEKANNDLFTRITNALLEEKRDEAAIKSMVAELSDLAIGDVADFVSVEAPASYKPEQEAREETIFTKLAEIKAVFDEALNASRSDADGEAEDEEQGEAVVAEESDNAVSVLDGNGTADILNAIDELKIALSTIVANTENSDRSMNEAEAFGSVDVADVLEELRSNYLEIASKLVDISERIAEPAEPAAQGLSDDDRLKMIDDLEYIRTRIDDRGDVLDKIEELHSDILNITASLDFTEQFNSLLTEINTQFDKLYEDLSAALIETETNIINRISESSGANDAIEAARADILADTQAIKDGIFAVGDIKTDILNDTQLLLSDTQSIKDTLILISDAVGGTQLADAVEQLRNDLSAFADLTAVNVDASTNDRLKLIDDVAFLRECAEAELAAKEQAAQTAESDTVEAQADEKLYSYLDELTARVEALAALPDDVAVVKDNTSAVLDSVAPISDGIVAISDGVNNISADVAAINENVNKLVGDVAAAGDNLAVIGDGITAANDGITNIAGDAAAARDAAVAALDALTPISDRLNEIIGKLDEEPFDEEAADAEEERFDDTLADDLLTIREGINTILDTLPLMPQSDDLVTARDNTYSILDTLTMMPQNDDIVATRDNVAALVDSVNALSENVRAIAEGQNESASDDLAAIRESTSAILDNMPEGFAEDMAIVRDNTGTMLDSLASLAQSQEDIVALRNAVDSTGNDLRYIKDKIENKNDEEIGDSLASILQDLGLVLDKLEAFEQNVVTIKQDLVDSVNGIREEVHISELEENIAATGMDEQTREALVGEIAEIRERLNNLEQSVQSVGDVNAAAFDGITAQLEELQNAVVAQAPAAQSDDVLQTLNEINDKLGALAAGGEVGAADPALAESIEQIKDYISTSPDFLDAIAADVAEIKARLDGGADFASGDGAQADSAESLQSIVDELAVIKEKIDQESEYDTIGEILSLRDDVKAARIVDQNDVSGELEAIKNELAAISSGNILDEIRALRDEIAAVGANSEAAPAPTNDELNLVLNEIVSLRDEMFAFKDEVLSATAAPIEDEPVEGEAEEADDPVDTILDELTALRADQTALSGNIDELKNIISRRTTIASETDGDEPGATTASNELNVVLSEIINLKNDIERVEDSLANDGIDALSVQVEEIRGLIDGLTAEREQTTVEQTEALSSDAAELAEIKQSIDNIALNTSAVDLSVLADQINELSEVINSMRLDREQTDLEDGVVQDGGSVAEQFDILHAEIDEVKAAVGDLTVADEIAELRSQLAELREENARLREENSEVVAAGFNELREAIREMSLASAPVATENGDTSYAALIDEIRGLKDQVAANAERTQAATLDEDTLRSIRDALAGTQSDTAPLADELAEIRDEIAQLRSLTAVTAESGGSTEIAAIRDELGRLKQSLSDPEHMSAIAEDVYAIKSDVQTLKEEPDLGVINEILALRDEFQSLREEIEDVKRVASETDSKSDDTILAEVQSLRDQLFAISMANVNDSASGESNYESYNNLILDELSSLRETVDAASSADDLRTVTEELSKMKATLDEREELYDALSERVSKLGNDATNNKILDELGSLRTELANQRDADLTTLNFMSEMAHLLERQNNYISQTAGSKITDEIESLKAEIASTDSVAEEVAKLREIMTQYGNASDNDTILNELAELREELSDEKPSRENELILKEIARLRDELTALADRDATPTPAISDDLQGSLTDLKDQLNEIAGIIEPEKEKPAAKKTTRSTSKTTKSTKSGGTKKKSASGQTAKRKPAQKRTTKAAAETASVSEPIEDKAPAVDPREPEEVVIDFDSKVNEELTKLGGNGDYGLDPRVITSDTMDVADKLAQQVANKLVMEQLVEQLGDGGVSDERVDEILKDILPQEFTTVALNEQSDKVRRLANQLVLNKLRNRLGGKKNDD